MALFSAPYDRSKLLSQAARARARGRRKKAIGLYSRVLDNEPENHVLHRRVAQLLAQSGRLEEALAHYRIAGDELARQGFGEHAIALLREALHFEPRVTWVWRRVADLEIGRGHVFDAVETLRQGARCFRSRKERRIALGLLEEAHRLDPGSVDAALELSRLLWRDRKRARAHQVLREVVPHVRGRGLRRIRARQLYWSPTPAAFGRWLCAWFSRGGRVRRPALFVDADAGRLVSARYVAAGTGSGHVPIV